MGVSLHRSRNIRALSIKNDDWLVENDKSRHPVPLFPVPPPHPRQRILMVRVLKDGANKYMQQKWSNYNRVLHLCPSLGSLLSCKHRWMRPCKFLTRLEFLLGMNKAYVCLAVCSVYFKKYMRGSVKVSFSQGTVNIAAIFPMFDNFSPQLHIINPSMWRQLDSTPWRTSNITCKKFRWKSSLFYTQIAASKLRTGSSVSTFIYNIFTKLENLLSRTNLGF